MVSKPQGNLQGKENNAQQEIRDLRVHGILTFTNSVQSMKSMTQILLLLSLKKVMPILKAILKVKEQQQQHKKEACPGFNTDLFKNPGMDTILSRSKGRCT